MSLVRRDAIMVWLGYWRDDLPAEAVAALQDICGADREARTAALTPEDEQRLREYLWLSHGHQGVYGDDGEMQCSECAPVWDYKRAPLAEVIQAATSARRRIKIEALASPPAHAAETAVTRFEVIDHRKNVSHIGRVYSAQPCKITLSYQDDGRTLKVFVDAPVRPEPT